MNAMASLISEGVLNLALHVARKGLQYKTVTIEFKFYFFNVFCSRQQTHSLCVGMISHRSQVHQNVPSK